MCEKCAKLAHFQNNSLLYKGISRLSDFFYKAIKMLYIALKLALITYH